MRKILVMVATGVTGMVASASTWALATPIDTAEAVLQVAEANTAVAAVGGALLILAAISLAFRWVKASFF